MLSDDEEEEGFDLLVAVVVEVEKEEGEEGEVVLADWRFGPIVVVGGSSCIVSCGMILRKEYEGARDEQWTCLNGGSGKDREGKMMCSRAET